MDSTSNNKRIAKNTIFLYIRMMIIMLVTLFTSRIILQSLGVEDYGIYNLVGGVTSMFTFLNGALSDATQRYLTFEIGRGKEGNVNKIFSLCMILHIIMAVIVVIITEIIGLWFMYNKLQIPAERMDAAFWVFQFSVASMFIMFVSVPYNALIIAHERMKAFAFISIFTTGINLLIAYALFLSGSFDRLILYGFLLFVLQIITRLIYNHYCRRNFEESKFRLIWDSAKVKELAGFMSWTIIGNISYITYTQGLNLLLGMFFLPVVNAARGIAIQVQSAANQFVRSFQTAINPQITKTYAANDYEAMYTLVCRGSRFSSFLLMIPIVPIIVGTPILLNMWLTEIPDYTCDFIRIILLTSWINGLSNPLGISNMATGNIKLYQLTVATIKLLILPIAYVCLQLGYSPVSVFIAHLFIECIAYIVNIIITHHLTKLPVNKYIRDVILRVFPIVASSLMLSVGFYSIMKNDIISFILMSIFSFVCSAILIYAVGLSKDERDFLKGKVIVIINKKRAC